MLKAFLFDLDGTLLPMDQDYFLQGYFEAVTAKFSHLLEPRKLIAQIMESTKAMISNTDPGKTNMDVFVEDFVPKIGYPRETVWPLFDQFYDEEFSRLCSFTRPTDISRQIVDTLKEKGYEIVVATNPLFPARAIEHRLNWVNLRFDEFKLVTTYETMHFCKPNPDYFREILQLIGRKPEECLMVGNDACEDLAARSLGIRTFLVKDCLIDGTGGKYVTDYEGTLLDLLEFIRAEKWKE